MADEPRAEARATVSADIRSQAGVGAALWCLLALVLLKGIRMPNRWAVTHYLFTYQGGFMKRALWGEILRLLFGRWTASYFFMAGVGLAMFALMIALIVAACRRLAPNADRLAFLLVFLASPALSFSAHLAGYLEQVVYAAWLLLLFGRRWRVQLAMAIGIAALAPLVHEASVLWLGGLTGLALLANDDLLVSRRQRLAGVALVSAIRIASSMGATVLGRVSVQRAEIIRDGRTAFFSIRPRQDAFATLTVPLRDSLADMRRRWRDPDTQAEMAFSLAVFGPAAIFLGVIAWRRARALDRAGGLRGAATALTLAAIAGPLLLHFVGWDRHRWNALATLNAGLAALALAPRRPVGDDAVRAAGGRVLPAVAFVICLWSVCADPVFFDQYTPAHPPFADKVQFLWEAIRTGNPDIWIPDPGK